MGDQWTTNLKRGFGISHGGLIKDTITVIHEYMALMRALVRRWLDGMDTDGVSNTQIQTVREWIGLDWSIFHDNKALYYM